ncbi:MAG: helix-turn-helix domain-containing protein [Candidatus Hydrogenedentes bacterium]|nr:helix-turn-helix domain-containing protein [Candidatus Hydrogenedentota bacterium]
MTAHIQEKPMMLGTREAAEFLGMSLSFLRMSRCEGHRGNRTPGPPFYKIGKVVRYSTADLRAWLDARRCETGA